MCSPFVFVTAMVPATAVQVATSILLVVGAYCFCGRTATGFVVVSPSSQARTTTSYITTSPGAMYSNGRYVRVVSSSDPRGLTNGHRPSSRTVPVMSLRQSGSNLPHSTKVAFQVNTFRLHRARLEEVSFALVFGRSTSTRVCRSKSVHNWHDIKHILTTSARRK